MINIWVFRNLPIYSTLPVIRVFWLPSVYPEPIGTPQRRLELPRGDWNYPDAIGTPQRRLELP